MLSRFIMNLYERDRQGRAQGLVRVRAESALSGAIVPWAEFARVHDFAFDEEGTPAIRGLIGIFSFQLEAVMDHEGLPFMQSRLTGAVSLPFVIEPRVFRHRLPTAPWKAKRYRSSDAAFDAAYTARGAETELQTLLTEPCRMALLALHFRTPCLECRGGAVVLELEGIELDPTGLANVVAVFRAIADCANRGR
jgi:hypothetical protein